MIAAVARQVARTLARRPLFFLAVGTPLALGIAVSTALFSAVSAYLLRPLDLPHAKSLVYLYQDLPDYGGEQYLSPANLLDLRAGTGSFAALAAYQVGPVTLTGAAEPVRLQAAIVDADFWRVVGIRPASGHLFAADDHRLADAAGISIGRAQAVLISHALWTSRYARAPVAGRSIVLDGRPHAIVGVLPPETRFPDDVDLWLPLVLGGVAPQDRGSFQLQAVGRLAPGIDVAAARAELAGLAPRLERAAPEINAGIRLVVVPLREHLVERLTVPLWALFTLSVLILVGVSMNAAYLLLARHLVRRGEIALRVALGAGRGDVLFHTIAEGALVAGLSAMAGLLLAGSGLRLALRLVPISVAGLRPPVVDATAVAFAMAVAALVAVVCSLGPAFQLRRSSATACLLNGEGLRSSLGNRHLRLQAAMVTAQIALSTVLLVAMALMARTYRNLTAVELAFEPRQVLTLSLTLPEDRYRHETSRIAFTERVIGELAALPGAQRAAAALRLPVLDLGGGIWFRTALAGDRGTAAVDHDATFNVISGDYFRTLGIPLLQGRSLADTVDAGAEPVTVVSQELARRHYPGGDALGRELILTPWPERRWRIVGVAADVRQNGLREPVRPAVYIDYRELPVEQVTFVVRTVGEPAALAAAARRRLWSVDPELGVERVAGLEAQLADAVRGERSALWLVGSFAGLGLLLAASGVYASLAYLVAQRRGELGVRLAMGAQREDILRQVVIGEVPRTVAGLALGLLASILLGGFAASLLYGVGPADPISLLGSGALLLAVVGLATLPPARRAARSDPLTVLRSG